MNILKEHSLLFVICFLINASFFLVGFGIGYLVRNPPVEEIKCYQSIDELATATHTEWKKFYCTYLEGDMNHDNELTIKDLSILAAQINSK